MIVFFGISHNDNTISTELTCAKSFSYVQKNKRKGVVDITSRPRQLGVRMLLFQRMPVVFDQELNFQKFRPESNLSRVCLFRVSQFLQLVMKNFTSDARTRAETSARTRALISP